jgi:lipoate-protein ligase A
MTWKVLDTGRATAQANMALDCQLLDKLDQESCPLLHFYEWIAPSATYGHFIDPTHFFRREGAERMGLQLAKRPTGGGNSFHLWDFAFSVLVPASHPAYSINSLENYSYVNRIVIEVVKRFCKGAIQPDLFDATPLPRSTPSAFCMALPTQYDVVIEGKKVGGAAQRRTRAGFLHQGTISLLSPSEEFLAAVLQEGAPLFLQMSLHSHALLPPATSLSDLHDVRQELKQLFIFPS